MKFTDDMKREKKEEAELINFVKSLPKNKYAVMLHSFVTRDINAPVLIVIEKINLGGKKK